MKKKKILVRSVLVLVALAALCACAWCVWYIVQYYQGRPSATGCAPTFPTTAAAFSLSA